MQKKFPFIALMLMLLTVSIVQAQNAPVPQRMNFQGRLANPSGNPVPDGNYSIRFSLWTAAAGGTEKWSQTINPVAVKNGTFAVLLNTGTGATDKFAGDLFLEIKVGNDSPLASRQPLSTVAYAFKADSVRDGGIGSAQLANGSITTNKLTDGAVTANKLDGGLLGTLSSLGSDYDHFSLIGSVPLQNSAKAVAVSGNFAYVLTTSTNNFLTLYDISNPVSVLQKGSVETSLSPTALAASGNFAYVLSSNDKRLRIYDFSNPAAPVPRGNVGTGNYPISIAVANNHVYVVNRDSATLEIFDVSNPDAPFLQGSITTALQPKSISVSGNRAAIVCSFNQRTLATYDVSDPSIPFARGSISVGGDPICVTLSGDYAYITHQLPNSPLQIYNIRNIGAYAFVTSFTVGAYPYAMAVSEPYVFAACSGNSPAFKAFHIGNPSVPIFVGGNVTKSAPISIAVAGDFVYAVNQSITDPSLQIFTRRTRNVNANFSAQGGGSFGGGITVDQADLNYGSLANGLTFGRFSGEGVASQRTAGANQWGLDFYTAFQPRMTITNMGSVGIGTQTPAAGYLLDVDGVVRCLGFVNASDVRFKQNVAPLVNPLEAILNLRGVSYDWDRERWKDKGFETGRQIGFIAQEVEKVLPELVRTDQEGYKSVAYANVVPVVVEAIKAQHKQHQADKIQIAALKTKNIELEARLARLEAMLQRMQK